MAEGKCPDLVRELEENQRHVCGHQEPILIVRRHERTCDRCRERIQWQKER